MRCSRCNGEADLRTVGEQRFTVCPWCFHGRQAWQDAAAAASSARVTPTDRRERVLKDMRNQLRWYYRNPLTPALKAKRDRLIQTIADLENECDQIGQEAS